MNIYYDMDGNPIDMEQWVYQFEKNKRIDETHLPGGVWVSTVWLGLNHQYGNGPPLIFETMIFGGPLDQYQRRYSTKEEAVLGHAEAVKLAWLHWAFPTVMKWLGK